MGIKETGGTQECRVAGWAAWGHCAYIPRDWAEGQALLWAQPPHAAPAHLCWAGGRKCTVSAAMSQWAHCWPPSSPPRPGVQWWVDLRGCLCSAGRSFLPVEAHLTAIFQEFLGLLVLSLLFLTFWIVVHLFGFKYILHHLLELCEWKREAIAFLSSHHETSITV